MGNEGTLFDDYAGFVNPYTGDTYDDSESDLDAHEEDEELEEDEDE